MFCLCAVQLSPPNDRQVLLSYSEKSHITFSNASEGSNNSGDEDERGEQNITNNAAMNSKNESGGQNPENLDRSYKNEGKRETSDRNPKKLRRNQHGNHEGMGSDVRQAISTNNSIQFGGDVANEIDLLDFMDDEVERRKMVYKFVIEHVAPHIVWPDGTTGIPLDTIATKNTVSPHQNVADADQEQSSLCDTLSEQNLLRHNEQG